MKEQVWNRLNIKSLGHCIPDFILNDNIRNAMSKGYPTLDKPVPEHNRHIAIIGGAPSIEETAKHAFELPLDTMVIGSAHDKIIDMGYVPDMYCSIEPRSTAEWLKKPQEKTNYFLASVCSPKTYDALEGCDVTVFHAWAGDFLEYPKNSMLVHGGSTVASRAVYLAYSLGYRFFHLFGMDSCYSGEKFHAYKNDTERNDILVKCKDREFLTVPQMANQVMDFHKIINMHKDMNFFVYGDGLLQHSLKGEK